MEFQHANSIREGNNNYYKYKTRRNAILREDNLLLVYFSRTAPNFINHKHGEIYCNLGVHKLYKPLLCDFSYLSEFDIHSVVKWLALLLRIWMVSIFNLGLEVS